MKRAKYCVRLIELRLSPTHEKQQVLRVRCQFLREERVFEHRRKLGPRYIFVDLEQYGFIGQKVGSRINSRRSYLEKIGLVDGTLGS